MNSIECIESNFCFVMKITAILNSIAIATHTHMIHTRWMAFIQKYNFLLFIFIYIVSGSNWNAFHLFRMRQSMIFFSILFIIKNAIVLNYISSIVWILFVLKIDVLPFFLGFPVNQHVITSNVQLITCNKAEATSDEHLMRQFEMWLISNFEENSRKLNRITYVGR